VFSCFFGGVVSGGGHFDFGSSRKFGVKGTRAISAVLQKSALVKYRASGVGTKKDQNMGEKLNEKSRSYTPRRWKNGSTNRNAKIIHWGGLAGDERPAPSSTERKAGSGGDLM